MAMRRKRRRGHTLRHFAHVGSRTTRINKTAGAAHAIYKVWASLAIHWLIRFNLRDLRESNGSVTLIIVLKVRRPSLMTVIPNANLRRISLRCNFLDKFFGYNRLRLSNLKRAWLHSACSIFAAPAEVFSFMRSKISAKLWSRCAKYCQRFRKFSSFYSLLYICMLILQMHCQGEAVHAQRVGKWIVEVTAKGMEDVADIEL